MEAARLLRRHFLRVAAITPWWRQRERWRERQIDLKRERLRQIEAHARFIGSARPGSKTWEELSVADRIQKCRKPGCVRIPLEQIVFWPGKIGGIGLSGRLVHEVARDCEVHTSNVQKYGYVDLVEIPNELIADVTATNRQRCETDALMPRFAGYPRYVCTSKVHFVYAHKLAKEGNRTLFNDGRSLIRWHDTDTEGERICKHGPFCVIHDSTLYHDFWAMNGFTLDARFDVGCHIGCGFTLDAMGLDEMVAFGRVGMLLDSPRTPAACRRRAAASARVPCRCTNVGNGISIGVWCQ